MILFMSRSRGPKFTTVNEARGDNDMDKIKPL